MRHDHDDYWKQNKTDCNQKGIMSYYKPEEDQEKISLFKEKKWDDVWTSCNVEDLYTWWNEYGKDCSFVHSKKILPGTIPTYFLKHVQNQRLGMGVPGVPHSSPDPPKM